MASAWIIDLTRPAALVAMGPGGAREAVVGALGAVGLDADWTEARGRALLHEAFDLVPRLVAVELSRLGEPGLVGLTRLARGLPGTAVVLLLPGGIGGPTADVLGVAAVLEETDVPGLRTLAAAVVAASDRAAPQPGG